MTSSPILIWRLQNGTKTMQKNSSIWIRFSNLYHREIQKRGLAFDVYCCQNMRFRLARVRLCNDFLLTIGGSLYCLKCGHNHFPQCKVHGWYQSTVAPVNAKQLGTISKGGLKRTALNWNQTLTNLLNMWTYAAQSAPQMQTPKSAALNWRSCTSQWQKHVADSLRGWYHRWCSAKSKNSLDV